MATGDEVRDPGIPVFQTDVRLLSPRDVGVEGGRLFPREGIPAGKSAPPSLELAKARPISGGRHRRPRILSPIWAILHDVAGSCY